MADAITAHYSKALSINLILERIHAHYPDGPDLFQLAPVDQLHTGGIKASEKLLAHLTPEQRVLDIGAGLGGIMRLATELKGCQVIGLDITHPFNLLNRQIGQLWDATRPMTVATADGQQLPFADASFDRVLCQHSLVNIPDKPAALQEAHRVLKADGALVLHEILQGPNYTQLTYPVPWARDASTSHLMQADQLQQLLHSAGFEISHYEDWSDNARQWRKRQSNKEASGAPTAAALSPALVLGPDFATMGRNIMQGLESNALQVIELVARPRPVHQQNA